MATFTLGVAPVFAKAALHAPDLALILSQPPKLPAREVAVFPTVRDPGALVGLTSIELVVESAPVRVAGTPVAPLLPAVVICPKSTPAGTIQRPVRLVAFAMGITTVLPEAVRHAPVPVLIIAPLIHLPARQLAIPPTIPGPPVLVVHATFEAIFDTGVVAWRVVVEGPAITTVSSEISARHLRIAPLLARLTTQPVSRSPVADVIRSVPSWTLLGAVPRLRPVSDILGHGDGRTAHPQ